ncbi:MAG TPA: hypothetical protein VFC99_19515 [Acidimicrobiia bacterium]|nr:hypothetical protein [Acidimicrobiia bacterium]
MTSDGLITPPGRERRFVGESRWLRALILGIMGFGLMIAVWDLPAFAPPFAVGCIAVSALMVRVMPWRFEVLDEGLELWFALGRRRFLRRDEVTVRVNPGSPVALCGPGRRFGYPLTDGFVERRRAMLRSVLIEFGFEVA